MLPEIFLLINGFLSNSVGLSRYVFILNLNFNRLIFTVPLLSTVMITNICI